jgi:Na+/H+ antiporter NhaA
MSAAVREFIATQNAGAGVLMVASAAALVWANVPGSDSYERLWHTLVSVRVGDAELALDLRAWINDALMAFFFFVVGLEIRREFDMGELRERRRVGVPVVAALGGMAVPALIYVAVNAGHPGARGWGIVMGTDTALALGILSLVGDRVSPRARTFLLTVVIVDDVVALVVIALAYTDTVSVTALGAAVGLFVIVVIMRWAGVRHGVPYLLVGTGVWLATVASGVHATLAGVAIGLLGTAYPPSRVDLQRAGALWRLFREEPTPEYARSASRTLATAISPNERLQHLFHPWTSSVIVPLFALANVGVRMNGDVLRHAAQSRITIGIVLGLVIGKPLGIVAVTWFVTRPRRIAFPLTVPWPPLVGVATVAGIGFTVSLLIADISYAGAALADAKVGILAASLLASSFAWLVFRVIDRLPAHVRGAQHRRLADQLIDLSEPVDAGVDHVRGPLDAHLTLVEYGDFECPNCGRAEPVLRELARRFGDDLAFVFRHLPISEVHPHAELAAEAAEAAGAQGHFWEMHDTLIANAEALEPDDLARYARDLGLDGALFKEDLASRRHRSRVQRDVSSADDSGVTGTPTFFLNGRRHHGPYDIASLTRLLRHELAATDHRRQPAS